MSDGRHDRLIQPPDCCHGVGDAARDGIQQLDDLARAGLQNLSLKPQRVAQAEVLARHQDRRAHLFGQGPRGGYRTGPVGHVCCCKRGARIDDLD